MEAFKTSLYMTMHVGGIIFGIISIIGFIVGLGCLDSRKKGLGWTLVVLMPLLFLLCVFVSSFGWQLGKFES